MNTLAVYGMIYADKFKSGMKNFLTKERGGSEIVATIILVAIVVLLAVAFRGELETLVSNIWDGVSEKTNEINSDFEM